MSTQVKAPLSSGEVYGVLIGLGGAFALGMIWVTRGLKRSFNEDNSTTETYMVANRSVGVGLTASAVISSWLYSTALLGNSLLTYRYGLALGVWWGASASTMVCFLSLISIQAKRRAPNAHTLLELIKVRYGTFAHILWIFLCLVNNILVFSSMLLGAAAAVTSLTGMNVIASTYLLPLGVAIYTYFGGLRATFLTDYVHTFIIMIILVWFTIKVILVKEIGSLGALYDAIVEADKENPVAGNYKGSHLTMRSDQCLYFGILHVISNFGAVIMDTGFWQKGFSADVAAAVPGYVLGGVASFSVPWTVGTVVGLGAIALEKSPVFPTYPRACTSIASAQLIATSSIISFDIYGTYINKTPTNKDLIRWSHIGVVVNTIFIPTLATAFHEGGVNMTWLLYTVGNVINPGCFPTIFALLWKGQTKAAAIASPIVGMVCGLSVWFGTAYAYYGEISITSTGGTMPCLCGCVTSFIVPLPISLIISLVKSGQFDFKIFNNIKRVGTTTVQDHDDQAEWFTPEKVQYMKRMSRWAAFWSALTITGHVLLWPLPMYGAKMVFSKQLFIAWMVIAFIYLWFTLLVGNFYALFDGGFQQILTVIRGAKGIKPTTQIEAESSSSEESPGETKGGVVETNAV